MSTNIFFEIIIIIISIVVSAYLVMAEMAIVSARRVKLQKMLKDGEKRAQTALDLIDDPNNFLSVVQIGITLIGIIIGAVSGASLADALSVYLVNLPYGHTIAMVIVVVVTTYITLIIGELVPKRVGLNNPEEVSVKIASSINLLTKISSPLLYLLSISTDIILKIIGSYDKNSDVITEDDIKLLIEEGLEDGTIEKDEEEIIKRVFRLDEQKIEMLMTPKTEIIWIDLDDGIEKAKKRIFQSERSIFPVARGELDNILGVIQTKDILSSMFIDGDFEIEELLKQPLIIPENLQTLDVVKQFKENKQFVHMALIVDEHGSVEGLITLNDLLEGLVGDIPGIDENDEPIATQRSDKSWLIDGSYPIDRFKEIFKITEDLPQEQEDNYTTIAGFILSFLGKIPEENETFTWDYLNIEIIDMDGHHIDKLLVHVNTDK